MVESTELFNGQLAPHSRRMVFPQDTHIVFLEQLSGMQIWRSDLWRQEG